MDLLAATLWDLLTAAGSAAALTFIVALALGIGALTLFFFGSSVAVLEGFARSARGWRPIALGILVTALFLGAVFLDVDDVRATSAEEVDWLQLWLGQSLRVAISCAVSVLVIRALLRRLSSAAVARTGLTLLGTGYALVVGGSDHIGYSIAPAAAVGLLAFGLAQRRGSAAKASATERSLWWLGATLLLGVVVALGLGEPQFQVSQAGWLLLGFFLGMILTGLGPLAAVGLVQSYGSVEWFIALRYLVAKRRQTFISVISLICVGAVSAGVWLIITVLSVMNGFESQWRDEVIGNRAHLTIQSGLGPFGHYDAVLETVLANPEVRGAAPFLDAEGMVRGERGQIVGVRVRGIDPSRVGDVTNLRNDVISGSLDDLEPGSRNGDLGDEMSLPGIVIGSGLAVSLGIAVGDPLLLVSPFGGPPTPFGPAPRLHRFRVVAIFQSASFQVEEGYAYVTLASAQQFLRSEDVIDGIEVRVVDFYRSRRVGEEIATKLGGAFFARDWKDFFPAFFQALKTERVMMFVLLTMIMVVAAFVIVATLIMMIMEKSSDIAILKAMGAEGRTVERIFAIEGTLIGLAGTALGMVAGVIVTTRLPWIQSQVEALTGIDALPATVYPLTTLPWEIDVLQVCGVAAIAMVLSLGATLLPSRHGARLDPAEALRYE